MSSSWNFAAELSQWGPESTRTPTLAESQAYCASVTRRHYENFTVASWLLPRSLVPHFEAVYAYCRWSDDLADETEAGDKALSLLEWWQQQLLSAYEGTPRHPILIALRDTIQRYQIPPEPFLNLLVAFRQDQHLREYETFEQLLGYCVNSANPVGHLVLYLYECFDAERARLSDEVCTGLQLANFWQDVARDFQIGRIYLPREDRERFRYTPEAMESRQYTPNFQELLAFEVQRTWGFFERGRALLPLLPSVARADVKLFILGGEATLRAIEAQNYDVWTRRPTVGKGLKLWLVLRTLLRI